VGLTSWLPDWFWTRGGMTAVTLGAMGKWADPHLTAQAAAVAFGVSAVEYAHTMRRLRRRSLMELLPEPEFTPSPDDVARAGRLLTGARPRGLPLVPGWAWRSGAVRIRLEAASGEEVRYTWEAEEARRPALRTAARAYGAVEVRPAEALTPGGAMAVRELRLAGRPGDMLAGLGEGSDPLQIATSTLEDLEAGEYGAVVLDILPASGRRQRRQRERIRRAIDAQVVAMGGQPGRGAGARVREMYRTRAAVGRLDPDSPLYRVQVFTIGRAEDGPERAAAIAAELEAGFAQWAGGAHWRRTHLPGGWWRRYRLATGLFAPGRTSLVTGHEVGAWLRPPTAANASVRVRRSVGALSRPPRSLVPYAGEPDQVPIGAVEAQGGRLRMLAAVVREDDPWFSYIVGRAGSGKTEMAIVQALHVALRTPQGFLFVDPHGDAVTKIEAFLAGTPAADRIVRIDLGGVGLSANPGLNLLDRQGADDWGADQLLARGLRDTVAVAMHWSDRHVRVLALLSRAALALAELGRTLPGNLQPTIFQLESLLLDSGFRRAVAPLLSDSQRAYWSDGGGYENTPREVISAVLLLGDRLRSSPALMALLGQPQTTWNARQAMDEGQIVLATTGGGMDGALAASLIVTHMYAAARSRADLPFDQRRPFWLFLDELQTFDGTAGGIVGASLEELRKYAIRIVAMNQDPSRLTPRTLAALATNRSHMAAGATRATAASWLSAELAGEVQPRAIARLPRRRFVSAVTVDGEQSAPFIVSTVRAEDVFRRAIPPGAEDAHQALRSAVEARTGALAPRAVVDTLEGLDGRILAALGLAEPEPAGELPDVDELPGDRQEAAQVLVFERHASYREAARRLGVSVATIRRDIGRLDAHGQVPRPHVLGPAEDVEGDVEARRGA